MADDMGWGQTDNRNHPVLQTPDFDGRPLTTASWWRRRRSRARPATASKPTGVMPINWPASAAPANCQTVNHLRARPAGRGGARFDPCPLPSAEATAPRPGAHSRCFCCGTTFVTPAPAWTQKHLNYLATVMAHVDTQEFKELKNPLIAEKTGLEQRIVALEQSKMNRLEPLRHFVFEANQAQKWVKEKDWQEMGGYLKKVGSNRLLRAQTLAVSFKRPASLLAQTVRAVQRTTDVSAQCSRWWRRGELNPRPWPINQPRLHA
jgi:hypothetical protein